MKKKKSTIKLSIELKKKLASLGSKDETYEQIIEKLLERNTK